MDLPKLISLLHTNCLHFTRIDKFKDQFEGALPKKFVEKIKLSENNSYKNSETKPAFPPFNNIQSTMPYQNIRRQIAANCWHQNDHESMAMWDQYSGNGFGVAISSTFQRLTEAFIPTDKASLIFAGMVKYLDYDQEEFENTNNLLFPIMHKRSSFSHEKELRAVAMLANCTENSFQVTCENISESGIDISIKLDTLIDNVFVAPKSPVWYKNCVDSILEKYSLPFRVQQSNLDMDPIW